MNAMKNVACWRPDEAYEIIHPDVDAQPDYIFRATHSDFPVLVRSDRNAQPELLEPEEFLRRFLAPSDHVLVPVIGESGSGKSHLIRWMNLRLPETKERALIFVPKAQTNLREIVRMLIGRLPELDRKPYLEALQSAGGAMLNAKAQRTAILGQVHLALVNDAGDRQSSISPDLEHYLLQGLRAVFTDPHLRDNHFLKDGGFAAELAAHVFEKPNEYRPAEQRRLFQESDLPLEINEIKRAAVSTQEILQYLLSADKKTKSAAVDIVNRHLDWAIGNCLNLTGDRLIEIMLGIRRDLKKKNRSLVLLIEDFARLQGLDRALLQSLLEQREDLCLMRAAFANTTGFYNTIAETVLTRLTFVVDMNIPLSEEGDVSKLPRFVGRYMNALRWGKDKLISEMAKYSGGVVDFDMPNRCDDCQYHDECHATFGAADGYGLYPFTTKALDIMAHRADENVEQKFNPRIFQNKVLRPVALLAPELENGSFPPKRLLDGLGGVKGFSPAEQRKLEDADPGNWQRRRTLLQLWDSSSDVRNLSEGIHSAFNLPLLKSLSEKPSPPKEPDRGPSPPKPLTASPLDLRLSELEKWDRGQTKLSAKTAQDLRDCIFSALRDFIDWDDAGLERSEFFGPTSIFRPAGIYFLNQSTNPVHVAVSISIPTNWENKNERFCAVMALQGVLEAQHHGNWTFKDGAFKLACFHECLKAWSNEVIRQLRALDAAGMDWDPAASALEVRILAAMVTTPKLPVEKDVDLLRAGLGFLGPVRDFESVGLKALVEQIRERDTELSKAVAARRSAMKGGAGEYMDATRLLQIVADLRARRFSLRDAPEDSALRTDALSRIARLSRKIQSELPKLLQEETELRRKWRTEMETDFGTQITKSDLLAVVQNLVGNLGALALSGANDLLLLKNAFEGSLFDETMAATKKLSEIANGQPVDVAADVAKAMQISRRLATSFRSLLDCVEKEVDGRLKSGGVDVDLRADLLKQIDRDFGEIRAVLEGEFDAVTS